ncbi:MAG: UDP-3-O-(3-hydroxymyristoyl)glucosamine N-acyltransferase [Crocinitomicaceae bacterium]|nr:UDP-3-O-(3-hydroxymyristoyl)glucosamine N-acyltransferase [Crocinitomicaceae bacterium]|tara:strand:+ start:15601 stop:16635 length:1035 start_codon:yes stop_codon:yes gene_type:complete
MEFNAQQIAGLLGGIVEGNPEEKVTKLAKIEEGESQSITFLSNLAYQDYLYTTDASIAIIDKSYELTKPVKPSLTLIRVDDARMSFGKLLEAYQQYRNSKVGIDKSAQIAESTTLGENIYIGPNVTIGDGCSIGDNVRISANVSIGDNVSIGEGTSILSNACVQNDCVIGKHCSIYSGAIIGGDGFGFVPSSMNDYKKVVHIGNVIIEDHVEIGSNTTIDRGTLGSTKIRKGVKLDNLIQIGHNVEIGENTVMAAQCGVAGSAKIGKNCMIGGQVGIVGHLTIADEVKIAAQSGIGSSIEEKGSLWQGSPAIKVRDFQRSYVLFRSFPKIKNKLDAIERQLQRD